MLYTVSHRVHELRRRPPRHQGGGHRRRSRAPRSSRSPGSTDLHADARHRRATRPPATSSSCSPTRPPADRSSAPPTASSRSTRATVEPPRRGKITARRRLHRPHHRRRPAPAQDDIAAFSVPTDDGAIKSQGLSAAFEGAPQQSYDEACDCITDADDRPGLDRGRRRRLLRRRERRRTWPRAGRSTSASTTSPSVFTNHDHPRRRSCGSWSGTSSSRSSSVVHHLRARPAGGDGAQQRASCEGSGSTGRCIILPYAMPAFAMYLVWRDMFNTDFGLINRMLGTDINWFGSTASAMFAILLVQLWLGYTYMFLVCTGALQSIPADLTEAAGGRRRQAVPRLPDDHVPAAAGGAGAAADRVVRVQLQQLHGDLPDQRRRPVPAGQPERRRDRPPDHLHLPARLRRRRAPSTASPPPISIFIFLIVAVDLDHRLPPHPGTGGDQLMTTLDIRRDRGHHRSPRTPPERRPARQRQGRLVPPGRLAPPRRHPGAGLLALPDPVRGVGGVQPARHAELVAR